jgi:adenylate kinase family enzyme
VLEGFPETEAQCNLLKAMKVNPSVVFMFEQMESESVEKLYKRRVDPKTGIIYNLDLVKMKDKHLTQLMKDAGSDSSLLAQAGLVNIPQEVLKILALESPDASFVDGDILSRLNPREEDAPELVSKKYLNWKIGAAIVEDNF